MYISVVNETEAELCKRYGSTGSKMRNIVPLVSSVGFDSAYAQITNRFD